MLISEFARAAGMSVDTVRFYVRQGLLRPETGLKGGANPYQVFDAQQVNGARVIRLMQGLGFSLKEIGSIADEYYRGDMTPERGREIMATQLAKLEAKQADLDAVIDYTRRKIAWMDAGRGGPEPELGAFGSCAAGELRSVGAIAANGPEKDGAGYSDGMPSSGQGAGQRSRRGTRRQG